MSGPLSFGLLTRTKYRIFQRWGSYWSSASLPYILSAMILVLLFAAPVFGQEPATFFKQFCASCHWIGGGRLVGPDLKDVSLRQDRDWLIKFIADPKAMLDSKDPYVMKLQEEAKGAVMINLPGMTPDLAAKLLDLIDAESKLDTSKFMGQAVVLGPYSIEDAAKGSKLFAGRANLTNTGPACISCHTVNLTGSSLGGRLGPNLTDVFNRLQGRVALTAWLSSPPTTTMQSVFKDHPLVEEDVKYLVAYLESALDQTEYNYDTFIIWMAVVFCGVGGGALGLVVFGGIWSRRFRSVRRPLIHQTRKQR